jgi:Ion transport protein
MQVVVNALIQAIPAIFNVLLVCLVFWLIFSIMGVNLFAGRFGYCVDSSGTMASSAVIANKLQCIMAEQSGHNYSWVKPDVTFDSVAAAYLALFQVVNLLARTNFFGNSSRPMCSAAGRYA